MQYITGLFYCPFARFSPLFSAYCRLFLANKWRTEMSTKTGKYESDFCYDEAIEMWHKDMVLS
jgi:hypothetical protein